MSDSILLPYQQRVVNDTTKTVVVTKSRRIGITYALACKAVLDAADNRQDFLYLAYNDALSIEFVRECYGWAKKLGLAQDHEIPGVPTLLPKDGVQAHKLEFTSGRRIVALPSTARSLRGRQGTIILDEAAFVNDLTEVLRAAKALQIWGSAQTFIISTADSISNPFTKLCEDIENGSDKTSSYHKITFDDAIEEGLGKRVFQMSGREWSPEAEAAWRAEVIHEHGVHASAELFCTPITNQGSGWFTRDKLKLVNSIRDISFRPPLVKRAIRGWDLASTKPSATNPDPDYSASVRILELADGNFLIDDVERIRENPGAVESWMRSIADEDGKEVEQALFQDPGAAGAADIAAKQRLFTGYRTHTIRATTNKVGFAAPWASIAEQGRLYVCKREWTEDFLAELERFPNGNHDDQVDGVSAAMEILVNTGTYGAAWTNAWKA